ncbi:N-acetyltransferase [Paracoccus yeei]|uniref:N-acetyltransferase n=1 Tax=Paracoccus yeei TaxID=147645 RepID=A0A1V0GRI8_9RHOB|nr:GNAT family N-acetyltransferase [Paracoccus yeei]ARC36464.1 N-acetyltransferase [Paracoccus yeei]
MADSRPIVRAMKECLEFGLRSARPDEFAFAEAIYINAMRPLMEQLDAWDEPLRRAAIRRSFKAADSCIITLGGRDIGWMQVTERDADYNLAQIQILEEYCGLGIGTRIIRDLLDKAARQGRTVSLSAVRTNRAIGLYQRLGFRIIDPDASPIIDMVWTSARRSS